MAARILSVMAGVWLIASTFAWPHPGIEGANTLVVGVLVIVFALLSARMPGLRYLGAALGLWVAAADFLLPHQGNGGLFNNLFTGIGVFVMAMQPPEEELLTERQARAPHA